MATHKGKWISHAIKKAAKSYECHISGDTISKGEHYLNIQVATDKIGFSRYDNPFNIQETFTIALSQLADKSLDQILDLLPPFLDDKDKKIAELKKELAQIRENSAITIQQLWDQQAELQDRVKTLKIDRDIAQNEMETLRQTVVSLRANLENESKTGQQWHDRFLKMREYLVENGYAGKVRRDERIAELEHENQFLKEHIKILGGFR